MGGYAANALRPLEVQQNLIVLICLKKKIVFQGSTALNYKELKVLPVKFLYKQFAIIFRQIKLVLKKENKRENRAYDITVWYTN